MLCPAVTVKAQDSMAPAISLEARADYCHQEIDGNATRESNGANGKFLNVKIDGQLAPRFTYSFRHRLNKMSSNSNFFNATDWLHLDYQTTDNITLTAGKQVVAIGGFEYDKAPIDLYFCSEYWNNIPCYAWGVAATMDINADHRIMVQVTQSPFNNINDADLYSYNIMWMGNMGCWQTLWSVNMAEYAAGQFINYIALGNRWQINDRLNIDLDLMNRTCSANQLLDKDFSAIAEIAYRPTSQWRVFAKATYDKNDSQQSGNLCVMPGTDIKRIGAGCEYFPLNDNRLRLHANCCYTFGENGNLAGALADKQAIVDFGLTWRIKVK